MYYGNAKSLGQVEIAVSRDPRLPFLPTPPGMEYRVAMPLFGPWYWGNPNLPPESYYNPMTYPYPAPTGNFIPRWSGAYIQPRNWDPMAYELAMGDGLGQIGPQHLEDPTGGAYWDQPDPWGDPLGPGESLAVGYQWAGQLKPKGFAAKAVT